MVRQPDSILSTPDDDLAQEKNEGILNLRHRKWNPHYKSYRNNILFDYFPYHRLFTISIPHALTAVRELPKEDPERNENSEKYLPPIAPDLRIKEPSGTVSSTKDFENELKLIEGELRQQTESKPSENDNAFLDSISITHN